MPRRRVTWREGTKGKLSGHFAWVRVWPGHGWATGDCADAQPVWLLIEEQADGKLKFAFSNVPANTSCLPSTFAASGDAYTAPSSCIDQTGVSLGALRGVSALVAIELVSWLS